MNDVKNKNIPDFSVLIRQHTTHAYNFAYRLTGNEPNARELVQHAFTNAFKSFDKYERSRPFMPWLNRILMNIFLDGVRKVKSQRTFSLDGPSPIPDTAWDQLIAGSDGTPLEKMEKEELHEMAKKALNGLPTFQKLAVTLRDVERFSYRRIAEILEWPLASVRSRIHAGRTALRESFERMDVLEHA